LAAQDREQEKVWRDRYDCDYPSVDVIWPSDHECQSHWNYRTWPDAYGVWKDQMLAPRHQKRGPGPGKPLKVTYLIKN